MKVRRKNKARQRQVLRKSDFLTKTIKLEMGCVESRLPKIHREFTHEIETTIYEEDE